MTNPSEGEFSKKKSGLETIVGVWGLAFVWYIVGVCCLFEIVL